MTTVPHHRVLVICIAGLVALTLAAACSSGDPDTSDGQSDASDRCRPAAESRTPHRSGSSR